MAYTQFRNGFDVTSASAIDSRLIMTLKEMMSAGTAKLMPDVYLCVCRDNGKLYLYNKDNPILDLALNADGIVESIGHFRLIDSVISFTTPQAQENIAAAMKDISINEEGLPLENESIVKNIIQVNGDIGDRNQLPFSDKTVVENLKVIESQINELVLDGGDIE